MLVSGRKRLSLDEIVLPKWSERRVREEKRYSSTFHREFA